MQIEAIQKTLHRLIDQIEDEELLRLYVQLLENELSTKTDNFFKTSLRDLKLRAEKSLKSVEKGNTKTIEEFKSEVDTWKRNRAIQ